MQEVLATTRGRVVTRDYTGSGRRDRRARFTS